MYNPTVARDFRTARIVLPTALTPLRTILDTAFGVSEPGSWLPDRKNVIQVTIYIADATAVIRHASQPTAANAACEIDGSTTVEKLILPVTNLDDILLKGDNSTENNCILLID